MIDAIHSLSREGGVRVSAVSARLGITRPSVPPLIAELEQLGAVEKQTDTNDKRVVWVSLTALGGNTMIFIYLATTVFWRSDLSS